MTEDTVTANAPVVLDVIAGTGSLLVSAEWCATLAGLDEIEVTRELVAARERIEASRREAAGLRVARTVALA